jgi:hypothetical protein
MNYGNLQGKYLLFLFQSSRQCFIRVLRNTDFLNLLWSCSSNFTSKLNLLHMIIRYFHGINRIFSQKSLLWEKITPTELLGKLLFMAPMAICHHLKMLSSISFVNDSRLLLKNVPVLFTSTKKYSASKCLFDNAIYKIAEDVMDKLFTQKIVVPIMI